MAAILASNVPARIEESIARDDGGDRRAAAMVRGYGVSPESLLAAEGRATQTPAGQCR